MDSKLKGKTVVITGSADNIGKATAIKFAQEGANLVLNCKSSSEKLEKTVSEIEKLGVKVIGIQADVSKESEVDELFKQTLDKFGSVDILINNAGRTDKVPFLEAKIEDWVEVFNNNLFGTMLCSQKAAEIMLKKKSGKIINTSSIRGLEHGGREGIIAYSAAKAGVISFTKTLAKLLAPNITVNSVAPGFVITPNYDKTSQSLKDEFINGTLLKRWLVVDEIADAMIYLAKADGVTGEVLTVDAGWNLKL